MRKIKCHIYKETWYDGTYAWTMAVKKVEYVVPKKQNWVLMCNWKGIASHVTHTTCLWGLCFWDRSSFFALIYRKPALALSICEIQKGKEEEKGQGGKEGNKKRDIRK